MRRTVLIDKDWFFTLEDREESKNIMYDHSTWQKINLPHDWSTNFGYEKEASSGKKGGYTKTGVGWYRKIIYLEKDVLDKRINIHFDGVYMNSEVFINGHSLGIRPYGYISFGYDINEYLIEGINIIAVRVDCQKQESSRWYNGCGIYRHVWLTITEKIYVITWGTYITTPKIGEKEASVQISMEINNLNEQAQKCKIVNTIYDHQCKEVCKINMDKKISKGTNTCIALCHIKSPYLWSLETPFLYNCKSTIFINNKKIDEYTTKFGIRKIEFVSNTGFMLNGQNIKFKGVCMHHDAGVVGAAVTNKIIKKRLKLLKDMGCNAIRTSHNPFSPDFYNLCDELGIMVMDEIFDGWDEKKASYDYGLYFNEWHEQDLSDFVKRDRNHPSVVLWSIGNEVKNMKVEINKELMSIIHKLDNTRPVTCGVPGTGEISDKNRTILDIAGYNDGGGACFIYDEDHNKRPNQLMIATEAPHTLQTRGFYRTQTWWRDKNQPRIEIENLCENEIFFNGHIAYKSSYDNSGVRTCIRDSWTLAQKRPYLLGEFRWTGFDYYGETFGWPTRFGDYGVIGVENYPKDSYYLYKSMWTDEPMIHLLPHWTHNDIKKGTKIPVWVYTNCEEAEIFLNDKSLGKKIENDNKYLQWNVAYEKGELKVFGYINGRIVAKDGHKTAKEPAKLIMTSDTNDLKFDGVDTAQIDIKVCDKDCNIVPYAENSIWFKKVGNIKILGTENGNCVDTTPVCSHNRKAFNGLCMALIRSVEGMASCKSVVYAAAILGDTIFSEKTKISVDIVSIQFSDLCVHHKYDIYIKLNNSDWHRYMNTIEINKTTNVQVKIFDNDKLLYNIENLFVKGKRDKVIDLTHGNKVLDRKHTVGPYAKQIIGNWTDGKFKYLFKQNGDFVRVLNSIREQKLGSWWYDFPTDYLENQEYAGQGEIWFASGQKNKIYLLSQEGKQLKIENGNGAIGRTTEIIWTKN